MKQISYLFYQSCTLWLSGHP